MPTGFTIDPPVVTALVTCDNFTQSLIDGKVNFVGLFDCINVLQFPVMLPVTVIAVLAGVQELVDLQFYISQMNADMTETTSTFGAVSVVMPPRSDTPANPKGSFIRCSFNCSGGDPHKARRCR